MKSSPPALLSTNVPMRIAGRYRIEAELGRGGMGAVYRALDEGCNRVVALKLMSRHDARVVGLFEREYETLAKLDHPRVISVYDFGHTDDGKRYYTMELLGGRDLWDLAPLPWREVCRYLRDVCTTLALLHNQRMIHRDVNPRNVRLDEHGHAKLLDFGALSPFGVANELMGTPSCIAPETLRGRALDARTDLFSLGVVMYWALTRSKPYAIRSMRDAEQAWVTPPLPLSHFNPEIPEALNELVQSLLCIDPLGRAASAADVIDRLSAIGQLDDGLLLNIAESRLAAGVLVGRKAEQRALLQLCESTLRGKGDVVTVLGDPGMGRSRLLSELSIEARLEGLRTVLISGDPSAERSSLLARLVRAVLSVAPDDARACIAPYRARLASLLGEGDPKAEPTPAKPAHEPVEALSRSLAEQEAVAEWMADVARRRPLLVAIDDAHLVPPESALVFTLLGQAARRAPLLLSVGRSLARRAPPGVEQLAFMGDSLLLSTLPEAAVNELLHSIFGDVPHRVRLAQWLLSHGRGNPGQTMRLLKQLLARSVIRDVGGTWTLPAALTDEAPDELSESALADRIQTLPALAQRLARALALHGGTVNEGICQALAAGAEDGRVRQALQQLITAQLIVDTPEGYRVAQAAVRRELLGAIDSMQRTVLHRELAQAIRDADPDAAAAVEANQLDRVSTPQLVRAISMGLHLMRAGQVATGRKVLRTAAVELTIRGDMLAQAAPDLEAAVETHKALGLHRYSYTPLLPALTLAGAYVDFRLTFRYGGELMDVFEELAGLKAARRVARFLGGRFALWLCMSLAFVAYMLVPGRRQGATSFRTVLLGLIGIGTAVLSVCTVFQDEEGAAKIGEQLSMLAYFPKRHRVYKIHEFQRSLIHLANGEFGAARELARRALTYVCSPAAQAIPPDARNQLEAGILVMLGALDATRTDDAVKEHLGSIERLSTFTSRQTRSTMLVAYHGHRGERVEFLRHVEELDQLAAETNAVWRHDMQVPRLLWNSLTLCEDVVALKRAAQQIQAIANEVPSVARLRDVTHACYLSERGLPHEALARYGGFFESIAGSALTTREVQYLGAYARILRKAGKAAQARCVCERALAGLRTEDAAFTMMTFAVELELPLAHLALGELERARDLLDTLLAKQEAHDNPMLHGLSHGARAELALQMSDRPAYSTHLSAMEKWVRNTQHPTLFAQYQRLAAKDPAARRVEALAAAHSETREVTALPQTSTGRSTTSAEQGPASDVALMRTGPGET
ncbi:MAG: protein kinase [Myxococcales bacterium]